ncbi:hypothetical protein PVK06_010328 [Gossypium arboreum]|uniref:PPM-type phosphatase domain-containing protein n=1 Tax=Gossypium arboreum TaxID=29729 RepID=A0ABR0Q6J3_GOSAR|nr:hypothetical protein PVK06_010328 [Gossypium arboreum]
MDLPREATSHCQIAISLWQQGLDWEQYLVEGVRTDVDLSGLRDDDGVSGRGKSEDGKLSYGYTSRRGHRVTMDGTYDIKISTINGQWHFGARAAKYLKPHLFDILMKHPQLMTNTKLAMTETFQQTDVDFLDLERLTYRDDGSAAITAVVVGNHLYVAHVGDSRGIASKAGNVCSMISITRAFDNRVLKKYVIDIVIDEELELLVLACKRYWDYLSNEEVVVLARAEEAEKAAKRLTDIAFTRMEQKITFGWNFQCIVIKFHHPESA